MNGDYTGVISQNAVHAFLAPVTTQLTKGAALDRESEKAEPNLRWRGIPGACVQGDFTSGERRSLHILAIVGRRGLLGVNQKAESTRSELIWLPTLDTFRTFLGDPNLGGSHLKTLLSAGISASQEILHG